ncbi:unnamed protein product [Polarella glacialis]|uniref:MYND-type domain-containing protein n=1 Tax=Polarella glacialis TaxID=89957 RepID=A0A813I9Q5_POLGL|nr:unnamed protein product [Polarella glacialis]CAE8647870.1 unnamed protein product [Polarella glacialis]
MGCCMIGDYADALGAVRETPDWTTSVPYRVASVDRSAPESKLLEDGKIPVTWSPYPLWGGEPMCGVANADGKVRFPIPGSEEQADRFTAKLKAGQLPRIIATQIKDEFGRVGTCAGCFRFSTKLKLCGRCRHMPYCSEQCQTSNWKLHKLVCKKASKTAGKE